VLTGGGQKKDFGLGKIRQGISDKAIHEKGDFSVVKETARKRVMWGKIQTRVESNLK